MIYAFNLKKKEYVHAPNLDALAAILLPMLSNEYNGAWCGDPIIVQRDDAPLTAPSYLSLRKQRMFNPYRKA